jgi:hypothetical protein
MQFQIILRRPMLGNPDKERKWLETTAEQPDLAHAVAYLYNQLTKTAPDNVGQISSVVIRAPMRAPVVSGKSPAEVPPARVAPVAQRSAPAKKGK